MASAELGDHLLDTLLAIDDAVMTGRTVAVTSTIKPVAPVADDGDPFAATLLPDPVSHVATSPGRSRPRG